MSYTVKGRLKVKLPTTSGTSKAGKAWTKTSFVIEVADGKYTKDIAFDTMKDDVIDRIETAFVGDEVEVNFDVQSREYNGKYYTNANCYGFSSQSKSQYATQQPQPQQAAQPQGDSEQLPF